MTWFSSTGAQKVHVVVHAEFGDETIRGVYSQKDTAEAALVTRTPSGRRSTALDAHDERCCQVEEWEVEP